MKSHGKTLPWLWAFALCTACATAFGAVKKEGSWPEADKKVTLNLDDVTRPLALRKLADAAGWSLVVQTPWDKDAGAATSTIDIHVKEQPASKVLELVLSDGTWVAMRDGALLSLRREAAATEADAADVATANADSPPQPPPPPPAPSHARPTTPHPHAAEHHKSHEPDDDHHDRSPRGEDRLVTGSNLTIGHGETAHDVTVFGGNLDVLGTVTGDVSVTGGNVTVRHGSHIEGDLSAVGGNITVEDDAEIEGDVSVVGGTLHRGEKAIIGGDVTRTDSDRHDAADAAEPRGRIRGALHAVGSALTRSAFLFIFGVIVLALGTRRMELLRTEAAVRPMRSFALGALGLLGSLLAFVLLCITVIGIPVAFIGAAGAVFGGYAGTIAVLTTVGEALLRHKTTNTYVHLAVGCALFLVASSLPFVGNFVWLGVALTGFGVFVATRAAGFVPERVAAGAGPYRSPPPV